MRVDGFEDFVEIGRGGAAVVYAATQTALGRKVAVKVLPVGLADGAARRRFERECAAVGAIGDAPHVVPVYAAEVTVDGRGCIVMRLMRESLAARVRRAGPLTPAQAVAAGHAAALALEHAHARGVMHRDVKPANLLLSHFDEVALADFDIASVGGALPSGTVTQASMSPPHAPPERHRGDDASVAAGDVWSWGSTVYALLEGTPPFGTTADAGGMAGLIGRVLHDDVPPWRRADVPAALDEVVRAALSKEPADRPTPSEVAAVLAELATDLGAPRWNGDGDRAAGGVARDAPLTAATAREPVPEPELDVRAAREAAQAETGAGGRSPWATAASTVLIVASVAVALVVAALVAIG